MPGFADDNDSLFYDVPSGLAEGGSFYCGFTSPHLPSYLWRVVVILPSRLFTYSLGSGCTSVHADAYETGRCAVLLWL